jgi:hypothetical protein
VNSYLPFESPCTRRKDLGTKEKKRVKKKKKKEQVKSEKKKDQKSTWVFWATSQSL